MDGGLPEEEEEEPVEAGEADRILACAWACSRASAELTGGLFLLLPALAVVVESGAGSALWWLLIAGPMAAVCERRWAINSSEELKRRPQKSRPCIQLHM
jgi:hypothetical protein